MSMFLPAARSLLRFWALIVCALVLADGALAQSTWRPTTVPRDPKPPRFDEPRLPKIDHTQPHNWKADKTADKAADAPSVVPAPADSLQPTYELGRWWLPNGPLPRLDPIQLPVARQPVANAKTARATFKRELTIRAFAQRPALVDFHDVFLDQELNGGDNRNHDAIDWTRGGAAVYRLSFTRRLGLRFHVEFAGGRTRDRQTWSQSQYVDGPVSLVRDEQTVSVYHGTLGTAVTLGGQWNHARWSAAAGALAGWGRIGIRYEFDGARWYDYKSAMAWSVGGFVETSLTAPITDRVGLELAAGYRLLSRPELSMGEGDWYWVAADGSQRRAVLDLEGWSVGIGVGYRH
ncbi:MAG: hypothetical protein IPK64_00335 [bacterium]|nr:hypothetical protein [bacterium]